MKRLSYISPKATVRESAIHGLGLFAVEPLARDEIVCVKGGYIFDRERLREVEPLLGAAEIQIGADLFIGALSEEEREGCMIFSNHSCEPNLGVRGQIVFVSMGEIAAGEELTHDWAMTDNDTYAIECRCGAAACRSIVTGQDWRTSDLQEKYAGYISSYMVEQAKAGS